MSFLKRWFLNACRGITYHLIDHCATRTLRQAFARSQVAVILGMTGTGKSTLAQRVLGQLSANDYLVDETQQADPGEVRRQRDEALVRGGRVVLIGQMHQDVEPFVSDLQSDQYRVIDLNRFWGLSKCPVFSIDKTSEENPIKTAVWGLPIRRPQWRDLVTGLVIILVLSLVLLGVNALLDWQLGAPRLAGVIASVFCGVALAIIGINVTQGWRAVIILTAVTLIVTFSIVSLTHLAMRFI